MGVNNARRVGVYSNEVVHSGVLPTDRSWVTMRVKNKPEFNRNISERERRSRSYKEGLTHSQHLMEVPAQRPHFEKAVKWTSA
jgi:hypothetical protein